jgi:peptide-methionine (S)-S-oxide reductase
MNDGDNQYKTSERITLGGGCFWCLEPVFRSLQGVSEVVVGYAGGSVSDPSYQLVCTGTTGHAEVAQVTFDPALISLEEILEVFFTIHDPTTLNRQGHDVGTQYRSAIYFHDPGQRAVAERVIETIREEGLWPGEIVTELAGLETFYPAEDYHQAYYEKNPHAGYCQAVISPKLAKFRQRWQDRLKAEPA